MKNKIFPVSLWVLLAAVLVATSGCGFMLPQSTGFIAMHQDAGIVATQSEGGLLITVYDGNVVRSSAQEFRNPRNWVVVGEESLFLLDGVGYSFSKETKNLLADMQMLPADQGQESYE